MIALDGYECDGRGPPPRAKLNQKPQSTPKEEDSSPSTSQGSRVEESLLIQLPEQEVEEWKEKSQERLQQQLDEPKLHHRLRERQTPELRKSKALHLSHQPCSEESVLFSSDPSL